MASKAEKKRKRSGRPRKVGARTEGGRLVARPYVEDAGPTAEMVRQLEANGPTCPIQWLETKGHITGDQAKALDVWRGYRAAAGFSRRDPGPVEGRMQPQGGSGPVSDGALERATERYREGSLALRLCGNRFAHEAARDVCDGQAPRSLAAVKVAAEVLREVYILGVRRAA